MGLVSTVKDVVQPVLDLPLKRPDGDLVKTLHPYRRMLSFVMPGRNESVVYYDDYVKADENLTNLQYETRLRTTELLERVLQEAEKAEK